MITSEKFSDREKIELWTNFVTMTQVRELILDEIDNAIQKKDTLAGCTVEDFNQRKGQIEGMRHIRALLARKPQEL